LGPIFPLWALSPDSALSKSTRMERHELPRLQGATGARGMQEYLRKSWSRAMDPSLANGPWSHGPNGPESARKIGPKIGPYIGPYIGYGPYREGPISPKPKSQLCPGVGANFGGRSLNHFPDDPSTRPQTAILGSGGGLWGSFLGSGGTLEAKSGFGGKMCQNH